MKQVANYSVIIDRQQRLGTNKWCYIAYVPTLGIATEADTVEDVQKEIESLVKFHIESLVEEGDKVPVETKKPLLTTIEASLPKGAVIVGA